MSRLKVDVSSWDVRAKLLRVVFWNVVAPGWADWLGECGGDVLTTGVGAAAIPRRARPLRPARRSSLELQPPFRPGLLPPPLSQLPFRRLRLPPAVEEPWQLPQLPQARGGDGHARCSWRSFFNQCFASDLNFFFNFYDFFHDYRLNHSFTRYRHLLFDDYCLEHWLPG